MDAFLEVFIRLHVIYSASHFMNKSIVTILIAAVLSALGCQALKRDSVKMEFVRVDGGRFTLGGKPYLFVGTNYWYGAYVAASDPERMKRELDFLAKNDVKNLRVLALSEESQLERSIRPATLKKSGDLNSNLMEGLDLFLEEAAKRDFKVVLYFTNFWQWSGGMSQYVNWFGEEPLEDPDLTGDWDAFMKQSASFYTCEPCQELFRESIHKVIARKNTVNGRTYRNDPTIMAWQLANEPRPGGAEYDQVSASSYIKWVDQTAHYIKSLAPRQLVSSGSEGIKGSQDRELTYILAHKSTAIDYLTVHMWIKNWGWFDIKNPDVTFDYAKQMAKLYIDDHIRIAKELGKPLVLEEFGAERDEGDYLKISSTYYRDQYFDFVFKLIEKNQPYFSGTNFWAFGGIGEPGINPDRWQMGDDYLGDPPQEPQGLNSVFVSDDSTWDVIRSHAERLIEIN